MNAPHQKSIRVGQTGHDDNEARTTSVAFLAAARNAPYGYAVRSDGGEDGHH